MGKTYNKILCPVDFSPYAGMALKKADELVELFGAELTLAHIVTNPWSDFYSEKISEFVNAHKPEEIPADLIRMTPNGIPLVPRPEEVEKVIEYSIKEFAAEYISVESYDIVVKSHEHTYHALIHYAEEQNSDLIVMATHGYTGAKRLLIGSVAENVVRRAPCSVLVVRE